MIAEESTEKYMQTFELNRLSIVIKEEETFINKC